jgi:hypothetical protein
MKCPRCGKQMSKRCDIKTRKCWWVCVCGHEEPA